MRRGNTRYFVVGLIVFTLILTGAYAILTATLNISGTATGLADFKLAFANVNVTNDTKGTATVNNDSTSITISTNLAFPGDTVTTNFKIKNTGTLAAKVDKITINNPDSADFTVQIVGINNIEGTTIPVNSSVDGSIVITWNASSINPTPENITFTIDMDFSQATT